MYEILRRHKEIVCQHWSEITAVTNVNLQQAHDELMVDIIQVKKKLNQTGQ